MNTMCCPHRPGILIPEFWVLPVSSLAFVGLEAVRMNLLPYEGEAKDE